MLAVDTSLKLSMPLVNPWGITHQLVVFFDLALTKVWSPNKLALCEKKRPKVGGARKHFWSNRVVSLTPPKESTQADAFSGVGPEPEEDARSRCVVRGSGRRSSRRRRTCDAHTHVCMALWHLRAIKDTGGLKGLGQVQ